MTATKRLLALALAAAALAWWWRERNRYHVPGVGWVRATGPLNPPDDSYRQEYESWLQQERNNGR